MREDSIAQKVFTREISSPSTDKLLYDFTLTDGDTISNSATLGSTITVDSVGQIMLENGALRKIIYLDNSQFYIESIGGSQGLYNPLEAGFGAYGVPGCVSENQITLWNCSCFDYLLSIKESTETLIEVYPNPSSDNISIKSVEPMSSFRIVDFSGRIVKSGIIGNITGKLDISSVTSGTYFLCLENRSSQFIKKIDVIR